MALLDELIRCEIDDQFFKEVRDSFKRCECGHILSEHCQDRDHCYIIEDADGIGGGACFVNECSCFAFKHECYYAADDVGEVCPVCNVIHRKE